VFIDERRNVIAHIENEPDGDEAGNAVKIDLQEIANDVSIKESHYDLERTQINGACQIMIEKNDEIRMTKPEGMTNAQMTKDCNDASSSFVCHAVAERRRGRCASFVIRLSRRSMAKARHSSFVISRRLS
jgi:hypothetical protein